MIAHWDEVEPYREDHNQIHGEWTNLGLAGESTTRSARAHFFRARPDGMRFLAYGTREANDICYYPRSNKLYFRGLGLTGRLEPLSYDDGEPED